jgi:hypothetical protein
VRVREYRLSLGICVRSRAKRSEFRTFPSTDERTLSNCALVRTIWLATMYYRQMSDVSRTRVYLLVAVSLAVIASGFWLVARETARKD